MMPCPWATLTIAGIVKPPNPRGQTMLFTPANRTNQAAGPVTGARPRRVVTRRTATPRRSGCCSCLFVVPGVAEGFTCRPVSPPSAAYPGRLTLITGGWREPGAAAPGAAVLPGDHGDRWFRLAARCGGADK